MPGSTEQPVALWKGPNGHGAAGIPIDADTTTAFDIVARVAGAMTPELLAETEWCVLPCSSLRRASWPG